jgi:hypothetical protein
MIGLKFLGGACQSTSNGPALTYGHQQPWKLTRDCLIMRLAWPGNQPTHTTYNRKGACGVLRKSILRTPYSRLDWSRHCQERVNTPYTIVGNFPKDPYLRPSVPRLLRTEYGVQHTEYYVVYSYDICRNAQANPCVCYLKTADDRKTRLCQVTQAQDNKASTDEAFGSKLFEWRSFVQHTTYKFISDTVTRNMNL